MTTPASKRLIFVFFVLTVGALVFWATSSRVDTVGAATPTPNPSPAKATATPKRIDVDCTTEYFASQADAQDYLAAHPENKDRLDGNKDGFACNGSNLPCPCPSQDAAVSTPSAGSGNSGPRSPYLGPTPAPLSLLQAGNPLTPRDGSGTVSVQPPRTGDGGMMTPAH